MAKGFDNLAINHQLDMSLPFAEYAGVAGDVTLDISKNHFPFTITGPPIWAIPGPPTSIRCLNFAPATPDYLTCPGVTTAALDYTSEDFSYACWINMGNIAAVNRTLICRGLLDNDGWYIQVLLTGALYMITTQLAGPEWQSTESAAGIIVINTWFLVGMSRDGALVRFFLNGVETAYDHQDNHVDPDSSNRATLIGIYDTLGVNTAFSQYMWNPRLWGDRALTLEDHNYIWETERHWFGL